MCLAVRDVFRKEQDVCWALKDRTLWNWRKVQCFSDKDDCQHDKAQEGITQSLVKFLKGWVKPKPTDTLSNKYCRQDINSWSLGGKDEGTVSSGRHPSTGSPCGPRADYLMINEAVLLFSVSYNWGNCWDLAAFTDREKEILLLHVSVANVKT